MNNLNDPNAKSCNSCFTLIKDSETKCHVCGFKAEEDIKFELWWDTTEYNYITFSVGNTSLTMTEEGFTFKHGSEEEVFVQPKTPEEGREVLDAFKKLLSGN